MIGSSKCQCGKCGLDWDPIHRFMAESFDREFKRRTGKEAILTSGARCPTHNAAVGGKPDSAHPRCRAGDWHFDNSSECYIMLDILFKHLNIKRIGINFAKNFIHWDTSDELPQNVLWKY